MDESLTHERFFTHLQSACLWALGCCLVATACEPTVVDAVGELSCNQAPELAECDGGSSAEIDAGPEPILEAGPDGDSDAGDTAVDTWPNDFSHTNSDPWLIENHDNLVEIQPRVLVINFHNDLPGADILPSVNRLIDALAEGSRYHGYAEPDAPAFLRYQLADIADGGVVDLTDDPPPTDWAYASSSLTPVTSENNFDTAALFSDEFAATMAIVDPSDDQRFLNLCEVFERGLANEVWLAVADQGVDKDGRPYNREPPLMMERKQVYDANFSPVPGEFQPAIGPTGFSLQAPCHVTVRLAHLNPSVPGCDMQVRGWGILEMGLAIPYFSENADAFFNADLQARFGVPFRSFYDICGRDAAQCVEYPTPTSARDPNGQWEIAEYLQGCGSPDFPPNAVKRWDWESDLPVESRCEHYGLGDGPSGSDQYEEYTANKLSRHQELFPDDAQFAQDCVPGWQIYWRQSMPGLDNQATDASGNPMKNWWPFLFY